MAMLRERLTAKKEADMVRLADLVGRFCKSKHLQEERTRLKVDDFGLKKIVDDLEIDLCPECSTLLRHGLIKLMLCTQDPKPMCKNCPVQCYAPAYKQQMRIVMKFVSQELSQRDSGSHPSNR